jgi:hypothetical protein
VHQRFIHRVIALPVSQLFGQPPVFVDRDLTRCAAIKGGGVIAKSLGPALGFSIGAVTLFAAPGHNVVTGGKQRTDEVHILPGDRLIEHLPPRTDRIFHRVFTWVHGIPF